MSGSQARVPAVNTISTQIIRAVKSTANRSFVFRNQGGMHLARFLLDTFQLLQAFVGLVLRQGL